MLKTLMISAAVSGLAVSGALAQSNPPAANPPAHNQMTSPAASPKFVAHQSANQWAFSKFKGTDVLGPDNAHIGDVEDVLFDKNGKVEAVVVGVGGFLGIGEKNVALDLSAFQVVPTNAGSSTAATNDPNDIKLKVSWTKEQLKSAPSFEYWKANASTTGMAPRPANPATAPRAPAPTPR
jgi:hypothetical protein